MNDLSRRARAIAAISVIAALAATAASAGASEAPTNALKRVCLKKLYPGRPRPRGSSVSPEVLARFAALRTPASLVKLPFNEREAIRLPGTVQSYDPHLVAHLLHTGVTDVYAIPVTLAAPSFPSGDGALRHSAGFNAVIADLGYSGPGPGCA